MGNYTKGKKEVVTKRMNQVHCMTLYCPMDDEGVVILKSKFAEMLPFYRTDEETWTGVPAIEALSVYTYALEVISSGSEDEDVITGLASSLRAFRKLKYINFKFIYDSDIYHTFLDVANGITPKNPTRVYKVEDLEINLSDIFKQDVIDMLNKVMMLNGILPNSYLERKFRIDFTYDDYGSFLDMFLKNNASVIHNMDPDIFDYFKAFPVLLNEQKPNIHLITNYREVQ